MKPAKLFKLLFYSLIIVITLSSAVSAVAPTTQTPVILPVNANSTDDLLGYCNGTSATNVNYYYQWYKDGVLYDSGNTEWCFQETATSTTACGGLDTGVYDSSSGYVYMNYSKITDSNADSLWLSKHGTASVYNSSIDSACWSANPNTLQLRFFAGDSGSTFTSYGQCYNGSSWVTITTTETINSVVASATINSVSRAYDASYSTSIWYYTLLSNWGTCTAGDCGKALLYEEGMWWKKTPYIAQGVLFNVDNVSSSSTAATQEWILSCMVKDGSGSGDWVNSTTLVIGFNSSIPLTREVVLESTPYMDYQDLNGYCNITDNNAYITYEWSLYENDLAYDSGSHSLQAQGSRKKVVTVDESVLVDGYNYTLSCRGYDGVNYGDWLNSTTITIRDNNRPTISSVSINPSTVYSSTAINCTWSYSDLDGDSENGTLVTWRVNNVQVSTSTFSAGDSYPTLSAAYYSRGDEIKCSVLGKDGYQTSTNSQEDSLTVSNSPPTFASTTLVQDPSRKGDALICSVNGVADLDGDSLSFYYQFLDTDNVTVLQSFSTNNTFDCSSSVSCNKSDVIMCRAYVTDTYDNSTFKNDTVSIVNTAPEARNVFITPYAPEVGDDLVCNSTYYDIDGDALSSTAYVWYLNDTATAFTTQTIGNANTNTGDVWRCEVTYDDGMTNSTSVNSTQVIIDATDPYVIVLNNDGEVDEGDNITFTWTWYNAGLVGNITHYLCNSSNIDENGCADTTLCTTTGSTSPTSCTYAPPSSLPHSNVAYLLMVDELNNTSTMESNSWLLNHRPTAGSISLNVTSDGNYNYYTCNLSGIADVDGDSTTGNTVYYFYDDSSTLLQVGSGTNTYIVSSGYGTGEEPVECRAQAYDGRIYSAYLSNDSHPRVQSLVIDSEVTINNPTTFKVRFSNTSTISTSTIDYKTSLNVLSSGNDLVYNPSSDYYELTINPNSLGAWYVMEVYFDQADGQSYTLKGDGDSFTVVSALTGGGGGESTTTVINQTTIIEAEFCGDGICQDNENPFSCAQDCRINYDSLITCLWDDEVECNWEQNWFVIFLIGLVVVIALGFIYFKEINNKPKKKSFKRGRR